MKKAGAQILVFLLLCTGFHFVGNWIHRETDGFTLRRIQFADSLQPSPLPPLDPALLSILQQPFYYQDCGNQCFVFTSADQKYVLKFFKYASSPAPHFLVRLPVVNAFKPFRPGRYAKVAWKWHRDQQGYQLAFNHFREETALVFAHLSPVPYGEKRLPSLKIVDKLHIAHTLDLNTTPFVVQKKALPVYDQFRTWLKRGSLETLQRAIHDLIALLRRRMAAHLRDDDVHFYSNFGFIGHQPVQIDPGHFTLGSTPDTSAEMRQVCQELVEWSLREAPELTLWIQDEIGRHAALD